MQFFGEINFNLLIKYNVIQGFLPVCLVKKNATAKYFDILPDFISNFS